MTSSVGRLEFEPLPPHSREWVIGAAPRLPAHWLLFHRGHKAARLVLLFDDETAAAGEIGRWLDATSRSPGDDEESMTDYMQRQLQDVRVSAALSVAEVSGPFELLDWMSEVVELALADESTAELPEEFAGTDHDVLLLPARQACPGRLALMRESRVGAGIWIENPRSVRL